MKNDSGKITTTVRKIGGSYGVTIPVSIVNKLDLQYSEVEVSMQKGEITIKKIKTRKVVQK